MLIADTLARIIAIPSELPVGSITAMAGSSYFIYLLIRRKRIYMMITTENLSYKYKNEKKEIFKNISVHFEKGDFAYNHPNGSGKTTLLKVLARILPTNHIIINNKNLDKLKTRDIAKI